MRSEGAQLRKVLKLSVAVVMALGTPLHPVLAESLQGDCQSRIAKANEDVLAFYPAAARTAGAHGSSTISCLITPQGQRMSCLLLSEEPSGQGFGKAAIDIAAATTGHFPGAGPSSNRPDGAEVATLNFSPSPPSIIPNLFAAEIPRGAPKWIEHPSHDDIASAYKRAGVPSDLVAGQALIKCKATKSGTMSSCSVLSEEPGNERIGDAAIDLAHYFKMSPTTSLGCSVEGSTVEIPIRFGTVPRG